MKGNLRADQLVFDLVGNKSGVTVQQAVVENPDPEAFEADD